MLHDALCDKYNMENLLEHAHCYQCEFIMKVRKDERRKINSDLIDATIVYEQGYERGFDHGQRSGYIDDLSF